MTLTVWSAFEGAASDRPQVPFLRTAAGDLTYAEVLLASLRAARGFQERGVSVGHRVAILMANSSEFVISWFGLNALGAIVVPMNTGLRESQLEHQLAIATPMALIIDEPLRETIAKVHPEKLPRLLIRHTPDAAIPQVAGWVDLKDVLSSEPLEATHGSSPSDPALVLFTSGTTGRSKGCVLSNRYLVRQGQLLADHLELTSDDVLYCPFPLFHADAVSYTVMPAIHLRTTAAIGARFSTTRFWHEVRQFGATVFDFMGATLSMLHQAPTDADDADNPVRLAWGVPVPPFAAEFERRFDLRVVELYGSTDAGIPIVHPLDEPRREGSCGRAVPEYEVQLQDDSGMPVPTGAIGEIVVRPREPHLISDGYFGNPDATLESRRNLWFHSGDLATQDRDGYFYFVGRATEVIRRRGENISAHEIEEIVSAFPGLRECAAFGVPSPLTEDDVMLVYTADHELDIRDLLTFCEERLATWMVPRYLEQLHELPHTPTEKVEKATLRSRGVVDSTWDREGSQAPTPLTSPATSMAHHNRSNS